MLDHQGRLFLAAAVTESLPHVIVGVTLYFLWWRGWRASLALPTFMGMCVVVAVSVLQFFHAMLDAIVTAAPAAVGNATALVALRNRVFADVLYSHVPCEYAALTVALALYVARPLVYQWKPHWQPARTASAAIRPDPLEADDMEADDDDDDEEEDPPPATLPALPNVFDVAISKMSERECMARLALVAMYALGMLWARAYETRSPMGVAVGALAGAGGFYVTERVALRPPHRAVFIKHE